MDEAGYDAAGAAKLKAEVEHFQMLRDEIKLASGDAIDLKMYEPAMRHLIDTYIKADDSEVLTNFNDMSLIELIVARGPEAVNSLPDGIKKNKEAVAETIENNVRKLIIDESPVNPKYYERMSELLDALIEQRRAEAIDYAAYLDKIAELTKLAKDPSATTIYPAGVKSPGQRALFDNLDGNADLALKIDADVKAARKADWRSNPIREKMVRNAIRRSIGDDTAKIEAILAIIRENHEY